jgi:hypothetical protein
LAGNFFLAGFHTERSDVKSAILPDSTMSGGFWEERNAKVTKTIKIHVEQPCWTAATWRSTTKGIKTSLYLSFLSGMRGSEEEKIIPRSKAFRHCFLLILCSSKSGRTRQACLFFAAATAATPAKGKERRLSE